MVMVDTNETSMRNDLKQTTVEGGEVFILNRGCQIVIYCKNYILIEKTII